MMLRVTVARPEDVPATFFWLVLMPSVIVIVWTQLLGICVFQFKEDTCAVSGSVATFAPVYRGSPSPVSYRDSGLYGKTNVTCYITTGLVGPAIELDTSGIVFHTCGVFSIMSIVLYFCILAIYGFCVLPHIA